MTCAEPNHSQVQLSTAHCTVIPVPGPRSIIHMSYTVSNLIQYSLHLSHLLQQLVLGLSLINLYYLYKSSIKGILLYRR